VLTRVEGELLIDRPVEEVFDFVSDERNEPRFNPRMLRAEKITLGPIASGTRFRAVVRTFGRPAEMTTEFIACERPRRLALVTHLSKMDIDGALTFEPVDRGTRMSWSWELMPRGLLKLASRLVARIGRRQERAIWSNLKEVLEHEVGPVAPGVVAEE
jgi:hypothetical protein